MRLIAVSVELTRCSSAASTGGVSGRARMRGLSLFLVKKRAELPSRRACSCFGPVVAVLSVALVASSANLACLTFCLDLIAAWIELFNVADHGWTKFLTISSSWRFLALPMLSCATAYVLSVLASRPGPTEAAPEAAARERACGSVF